MRLPRKLKKKLKKSLLGNGRDYINAIERLYGMEAPNFPLPSWGTTITVERFTDSDFWNKFRQPCA